jgi:hypothetical protein
VDDGAGTDALYRILTEGRPSHESTARRLLIAMVESQAGGSSCCAAAVSVYGELDVSSEGAGGSGGGRGRGRGGGSSSEAVDGRDHTPSGWDAYCPAPSGTVAGIRLPRAGDLDLDRDAVVIGSPDVDVDGSIGTDLVRTFAGTTYDALAASANIVLTRSNERLDNIRPRTWWGACYTSDDENWGAPEVPGSRCWEYLPVIHARGNLTITNGGQGQGILLVDGDLSVEDDFHFYGLVVVRGRADWDDEATLTGALLVGNRDRLNQQSRIRDEAVIEYSSCALARVLPAPAGVRFLPGRYWFEVP